MCIESLNNLKESQGDFENFFNKIHYSDNNNE